MYLEPEYAKSRITDCEFRELVVLPREIDLNEWLASNSAWGRLGWEPQWLQLAGKQCRWPPSGSLGTPELCLQKVCCPFGQWPGCHSPKRRAGR